MSEWQDKTDFEINTAITGVIYDCDCWELNDVEFYHCGIDGSEYHSQPILNFCNNPDCAWPVINSMLTDGLAIVFRDYGVKIDNHKEAKRMVIRCKNKLRAAMICYLEMNGVKP